MTKEVRDIRAHASFEAHRIRMRGSHCVTQDLCLQTGGKINNATHFHLLFEDIPRPIGRVHKVVLWMKMEAGADNFGDLTRDIYIGNDTSWTEASSFATMDALTFTRITGSPFIIDSSSEITDGEWLGWDITGDASAGAMERYLSGATTFTFMATFDAGVFTPVEVGTELRIGSLWNWYDRTAGVSAPFLAVYGEGT